jgi:hypothetical protein
MPGFLDPNISYSNQGIIQGAATGRFTNDIGEPVQRAYILIKGTNTGVSTDANGFFKIQNFGINSTMIVSAIGYHSKAVWLTPGYFSITLKESTQALEDVVVTGYGLQGKVAGEEVDESPGSLQEKKKSIQTVTVAT